MQVREMDNRFYEACNTTALLSLEKYGLDGADLDALPEDARMLLQDKDSLLNAVQVRCQACLPCIAKGLCALCPATVCQVNGWCDASQCCCACDRSHTMLMAQCWMPSRTA